MSALSRKLALLKTLNRIGWRRVALVAQHRRRMRSGYYERACPAADWPTVASGRSLFSVPGNTEAAAMIADTNRICAGELRYFSWKWMPKPATWRENPATGFTTELVHWSRLRDFDDRQGDVKWIWEPSRFDWAVTLARAFAATRDEKYKARFVELLDDWRANNPPNQGINWFCAQECSLRLLALVFAGSVFSDIPELWSTIAELAERVEPSLGYAIGQHNNHGISEAMGLYLAGMCLSSHPSASRWRTKGKELLCRSIREQFANDGSYVQHSFIYQRLAMRCCLACFHSGRQFGDSFPKDVEDRVLQSARFLYEMMVARLPLPVGVRNDGEGAGGWGERPSGAGRLPNYGANDGANALCLCDCDYLDFRPIIQLAFAMLAGHRAFGEGPWGEELGWYGIDVNCLTPLPALPQGEGEFAAADGGYYVLRTLHGEEGTEVYAFMRVPHYTDGRPSQADALHVDVWIDGEPVAVDSGTYSYNDPDGWWKHFKSTAAHNTVMVDGLDQMPSAGRFLFTDWTKADVSWTEEVLCGVSFAYGQQGLGIIHSRKVGFETGRLWIYDRIQGWGRHRVQLRWHLAGAWKQVGNTFSRADGLTLEVNCLTVEAEAKLSFASRPDGDSPAYGKFATSSLLELEIEDEWLPIDLRTSIDVRAPTSRTRLSGEVA